jgi:dynein heavy chain, axonemal
VRLVASEVMVQPSCHDVRKTMARLAKGILDSTKSFVRWMDGTCVETLEIPGPTKDDEPFVHRCF